MLFHLRINLNASSGPEVTEHLEWVSILLPFVHSELHIFGENVPVSHIQFHSGIPVWVKLYHPFGMKNERFVWTCWYKGSAWKTNGETEFLHVCTQGMIALATCFLSVHFMDRSLQEPFSTPSRSPSSQVGKLTCLQSTVYVFVSVKPSWVQE